MTSRRVLILGATSSIARALAERLAGRGDALYLAARDAAALERIAADLELRHGAQVQRGRLEAEEFSSHPGFVQEAVSALGGLDAVIFAIGCLGVQPQASDTPEQARTLVQVNLTSAVSLLGEAARILLQQGDGVIAAFSSVAGDRGRQSNYVYGAAKGGLSIYLQGLQNRLHRHGVRVITFKLGFVDTAMTWGKKGMFAVATPEQIARAVAARLESGTGIYYLPRFWRPLMLAIRLIPDWIFRRLAL